MPVVDHIQIHGLCGQVCGPSSVVSTWISSNMHLHRLHSIQSLSGGSGSQVFRCTEKRQLDWTFVRGAEYTLRHANQSWPFSKAALISSRDLAYDMFGVRIESWYDQLAAKGILRLVLSKIVHIPLHARCCPPPETKLLATLWRNRPLQIWRWECRMHETTSYSQNLMW